MFNYVFIIIIIISGVLVFLEVSKKQKAHFYKNLSKEQLRFEIIGILNSILIRQQSNSNYTYSVFNTHEEFLTYINNIKDKLKQNDDSVLIDLYHDFLPTGNFKELSINNEWSDDYIKLAKYFDVIYQNLTHQ